MISHKQVLIWSTLCRLAHEICRGALLEQSSIAQETIHTSPPTQLITTHDLSSHSPSMVALSQTISLAWHPFA